MSLYQHTQPGTLTRWGIGLPLLVCAGLGAGLGVADPRAAIGLGVVIALLLACLVLFHSLTVEVTSERVALHFGPGLIRKAIPLSAIKDARIVRNRWYYGWGIRRTPHAWLWNVSGFDAVELQLTSGKKFRIGTDDRENLRTAIRKAIEERS